MRTFLILTCVAALALPLAAQQTGDANRDYVINNSGAGGTSPVATTVAVPGAFNQTYTTMDANAPVIWVTAAALTPGALNLGPNSIDLDLVTLSFLANGTDTSSFLSNFFWTDGGGIFSLGANVPATLNGATMAVQMAHLAASSPVGFWVSQAHSVSFQAPCQFPGAPLALTDDNSVQAILGFNYTFYGTVYSDIYVGSNGFITFGTGDSDFTESLGEFLGNQPRIAMLWDDLTPPNGGPVSFFTDNSGLASVCFVNTPEFFSVGANTFECVLDTANSIVTITYLGLTAADGLVGMSPGGNIDPTGTLIDISAGIGAPNVITPGAAAYEIFDGATTVLDLAGLSTTWVMDASGQPNAQL